MGVANRVSPPVGLRAADATLDGSFARAPRSRIPPAGLQLVCKWRPNALVARRVQQ